MLQQDLATSAMLRDYNSVVPKKSLSSDLATLQLDPMKQWPPWLHCIMLRSTALLYECA